jgi:hypothetical protein
MKLKLPGHMYNIPHRHFEDKPTKSNKNAISNFQDLNQSIYSLISAFERLKKSPFSLNLYLFAKLKINGVTYPGVNTSWIFRQFMAQLKAKIASGGQ